MAGANPRPQKLEILRYRAVLDVGGIGVPGEPHARVAAMLHDLLDVRRVRGAVAVHLDPDLHIGIGSRRAAHRSNMTV